MAKYELEEKVCINIPEADDRDHDYHGETGVIVDVHEDELSGLTGNGNHDYLYTVEFDNPSLTTMDFRYDDLEEK